MRRTLRLAALGGGLLLVVVSIYLFRQIRPLPVEWSPENSLVAEAAPGLIDPRSSQSLVRAIDQSLKALSGRNPGSPVIMGGDRYTVRQLISTLIDFKNNVVERGLGPSLFSYLKQNYRFYRTPARDVRVTGYYEAELNGSLSPSQRFRYPLYRRPDDLLRIELSRFHFFKKHRGLPTTLKGRLIDGKKIVPYYSRKEIDLLDKISGKNLEMVWVDDRIDLFFLHIQGSGVVRLDTGDLLRVNYADSNGHPYRAIGQLLMDRGVMTYENMSMQRIRHYLETHPDETDEILEYNPSYVFFRAVERGPLGSLGVPLTPYRSVALDHRLFPAGALCYIETEIPADGPEAGGSPVSGIGKWEPFRGFALNQDTGGAIRGPGRIDLFTGHGKQSEWIAGHMKQEGIFYFLIKKE